MASPQKWLKAYAATLFLSGVGVWTYLALRVPEVLGVGHTPLRFWASGPEVSSAFVLAILMLGAWAAMWHKFALPSGFFVTADSAFALAALLLISPLSGVLIALSASMVDVWKRYRAGKEAEALFVIFLENGGNRLLRFAAAWAAYSLAGGSFPPTESARCLWASACGFLAYFLANNLAYLVSEKILGGDLKAFVQDAYLDFVDGFAIWSMGFLLALVASGPATNLLSAVALMFFVLLGAWVMKRLSHAQKDLKRKLEDLVLLQKVSSAATSGLDVMPMVEAFAQELCRELGSEGIGIVFFHRYSSSLYLVQVEGEKSRSTHLPEEKRFQYEQLPLSEASPRMGERLFEFLQPLETAPFTIPKSVFGLPLVHGGEPFGGIVVYSNREGADYSDRKALLDTCGQSLIVGLENCFLHLQAIQDPLTGLYNRSYLLYRLEEELAYSTRHRSPFALLMLDLDDFKAVNDTLGHAMGDRVLHRIGDLLRAALRREDVPARYGGDEFLLLLVNCDRRSAMEKAQKLRQLIATRALPKEQANGIAIGCSVGLLTSERMGGEQDLPTILKRLDQSLYLAKKQGKNTVVEA